MLDWEKAVCRLQEDGVAAVGFAKLEGLLPPRYAHLPYGVSLVWRLSHAILDEVAKRRAPTFTYFQHYRAVNAALDGFALRLSAWIEREGFLALPVAASQSVHDAGPYAGAFPHKTVAVQAGLGWIGKNALFISPKFGPRVRLASVLTDMPLPVSAPRMESRCGACRLCVESCPAGALTGAPYLPGDPRETVLNPEACSHHMKQSYQDIGRGAVCGVCVSVCPFGRNSR